MDLDERVDQDRVQALIDMDEATARKLTDLIVKAGGQVALLVWYNVTEHLASQGYTADELCRDVREMLAQQAAT